MILKTELTLTCGCRIRVYEPPNRPNAKFVCPMNLGHGYNLNWKTWRDTRNGTTGLNPKFGEAAT